MVRNSEFLKKGDSLVQSHFQAQKPMAKQEQSVEDPLSEAVEKPKKITSLDGSMCFFPPAQHFAMGSLTQISSGAIRCSFNTRFRARFQRVQKVPVQILRLGSGRFWCEVLEGSEGSGIKPRRGFGRFRPPHCEKN